MSLLKTIKQSDTIRWFFFGIAIAAVLSLTVLNIYSLHALRESTIESAKENRKLQLEEYTSRISYNFYQPFRDIRNFDMADLNRSWQTEKRFPLHFKQVLEDAIGDSLYSEIYFIPQQENGCQKPEYPIYKFSTFTGQFNPVYEHPKSVCDGVGISLSGLNTISLDEYRFNNRLDFDAHRSMTSALINLEDKDVVGHMNFQINRDYLLNRIMKPALDAKFGSPESSGMIVWIRDWMQDEILLSNSSEVPYNREIVDIRQRFPGLMDNWVLHASFVESPAVAATHASFIRSLVVLGSAVFVLIGALIFIFINAQKEREFAERQAGFLANVTHELKTPLAVMQAAGENISDGRVTDGKRLKSYGIHIYEEAIRLRKMIDKLLDVAKVDSGQTMVNQAPHHLNELVLNYIKDHNDFITNNGFQIRIQSDDAIPLAMVDSDQIETILNNLIENSIKYCRTDKEIYISIFKKGKTVGFKVADMGLGIPKKAIRNIFNKFYRVENSMTAKTKGHGLGLSIVKNLVELNGGKIEVESEVGVGSEFTITFNALMQQSYIEKNRDEEITQTKEYA
ncbi:MAG: sensor histidine kinase [Balneolaceae bacterium]|nr:MAG: sensor histidine kinase [Balneolaceae bacterium]